MASSCCHIEILLWYHVQGKVRPMLYLPNGSCQMVPDNGPYLALHVMPKQDLIR